MRTDENNNPAAFTTDIATQGGLVEGTDYTRGTQFPPDEHGNPVSLWTANLMGDPVALTIRVIDAIGVSDACRNAALDVHQHAEIPLGRAAASAEA